MEQGLNRGQAAEVIRKRERAVSEKQQRLEEEPEIEAYKQRLEELDREFTNFCPRGYQSISTTLSHTCATSPSSRMLSTTRS